MAGADTLQNLPRTPACALVTEYLQGPARALCRENIRVSSVQGSSELAAGAGCCFLSTITTCARVPEMLHGGVLYPPVEFSSSWPFSLAKPTRVLAAVRPFVCLPHGGWERLEDGGHTAHPGRCRAHRGSEGPRRQAACGHTHEGKPPTWLFGGLRLRFPMKPLTGGHTGGGSRGCGALGVGVCEGACVWTPCCPQHPTPLWLPCPLEHRSPQLLPCM